MPVTRRAETALLLPISRRAAAFLERGRPPAAMEAGAPMPTGTLTPAGAEGVIE